MSNLRAAPDWLTPDVISRVQAGVDRAAFARALRDLGLEDGDIVQVERVAAVMGERPGIVAGEMIRAAIAAIGSGGWSVAR